MEKTIAELIDELSIVNVKIFFLVEYMDTFEKAKKIQELNSYRSKLKNAINSFFKERTEVKV